MAAANVTPATTTNAGSAPIAKENVAPIGAGATAGEVDPAIAKQHEKEHAQLEKRLHKDEKKETKILHSAEKSAKHGVKDEAKALKAQTKATKALEKAKRKEAKYKMGLEKATKKHNDSVIAIQKAEEDLRAKTEKHNRLVGERDNRNTNLQQVEQTKHQHDAQREAALKADVAPSAVAH